MMILQLPVVKGFLYGDAVRDKILCSPDTSKATVNRISDGTAE